MTTSPHYHRVLLKISGESFAAPGGFGIDDQELKTIAEAIVEAAETGTDIGVVVGGGNMIRGADLARQIGIDQSTADYMGMLGTVMNGMALKEAIENLGKPARLMSAIDVPSIAETFIRKRALRHFEKGRIVILAAGTGNPFFTTDTCAALRAIELNADILLKATKGDGVYTADPVTNPDAVRYDSLTYQEAIDKQLRVMDLTAISMCMEHDLPVVVFDFTNMTNVPAVVTTALSVVLLVLLLVSLPSAELRLVCGSFFPIWGTARVTELFKLGTFWALQVQYGAYRRPDPSLVRADPYLAKLERLQRRGAADVV